MNEIRPIQWSDGKLWLLDQTRLPLEEVTLELDKCQQAIDAIHDMQVRGAPAIGVTAAYAMAMAAREISATSPDEYLIQLEDAASRVAAARPTAVNLFWAVERMVRLAKSDLDPKALAISQSIEVEGGSFTISGIFTAPGTTIESEIWLPLSELQGHAQRGDCSAVFVRVESPDIMADVELFAKRRLDLELTSIPAER